MDGLPLLEVLPVPEGHGVFNAAPHHARLGHGFREHSVVNLVLHLLKRGGEWSVMVTVANAIGLCFISDSAGKKIT